MMLYLAHAQRLQGVISHPQIVNDALPCTRATASPLELKSVLATDLFIVACTLAWFRTDKGLYALVERAMAYCWLRNWDKKRYNQTAIPFSFTFPIKWERVSCLRFKRKCLFYIQLKKLAIV